MESFYTKLYSVFSPMLFLFPMNKNVQFRRKTIYTSLGIFHQIFTILFFSKTFSARYFYSCRNQFSLSSPFLFSLPPLNPSLSFPPLRFPSHLFAFLPSPFAFLLFSSLPIPSLSYPPFPSHPFVPFLY